jgi:hypothetical protein
MSLDRHMQKDHQTNLDLIICLSSGPRVIIILDRGATAATDYLIIRQRRLQKLLHPSIEVAFSKSGISPFIITPIHQQQRQKRIAKDFTSR